MSQRFVSFIDQMLLYRPQAGMLQGHGAMMEKMAELVRKKFPIPMMAVWICTERCNLFCKYCHLTEQKLQEEPKELSHREAELLIDKVAEAGVKSFMFSGGEALMRDDIVELVKRGSERDMEIYLSTNGSLLDNKLIRELKDAGLRDMYICLDASSPENYQSIKGVDFFDKIIENIKITNGQGIETCVTMAVTKKSEMEVIPLIDLCISLKVKAVYMWAPIAPEKHADEMLNAAERDQFFRKLYHKSKEVRNKIALMGKPCSGQWMKILIEESKNDGDVMENMRFKIMGNMSGGCIAARYQFGISPTGDMLLCGATVGEGLGNILKDGVINIWQNSEMMKKVRNREVKGKCGVCNYKNICGGCRVTSWLNSGDYLESDPTCIYSTNGEWENERRGLVINKVTIQQKNKKVE